MSGENNRSIFDLEQQMLEFANVTSDIEMVNRHFTEDPKWESMDGELSDAILNKYGAIQQLYEIKFANMWETFEQVCKEYHAGGSWKPTMEDRSAKRENT